MEISVYRRFLYNWPAVFGASFLCLVILMAISADLLFPLDPFKMVGTPLSPPFGEFLLGTDVLGRDIAAGIVHGSRTSLLIGITATVAAVAAGIVVGAYGGFYGGWFDDVLMRITEFFQTIPAFLFAIVLIAILSPSMGSVIFAIAVVSWPPIARLVRAEFMTLREREFVQAAVSLGMRDGVIIFREILPNAVSPVIVAGSLMVATAILVESAFAFLGFGDSNAMSWGFMIGAGRTSLRDAWWVVTFPGLMIVFTVLSINLVGEGLNDALNPRLKAL